MKKTVFALRMGCCFAGIIALSGESITIMLIAAVAAVLAFQSAQYIEKRGKRHER